MPIDHGNLFQAAASLVGVEALADAEVGERFRRLMASLTRFDHVVVFAYRGEQRPIDLYATFNEKEHELFVSLYQDGAYLLDPFYWNATAAGAGVFRMRELAPDRFFSSEYYRTYYGQTGLAEEVGFFVTLPGDVTIVLSLMRKEVSGVFSASEFALLKQAEPLVAAIVRHFWADTGKRFDAARASRKRGHGDGPGPQRIWRDLNLTAREAAIIELVLQGHSSESIGLRLNIATGTVKVHRRNVYRKLGISSQIQLLSLYLETLPTTT